MRPMWYILDKDKNPVPAKDMIQANRLLEETVELVKNNLWVSRILDKVSAKTFDTKAITKKIVNGLKKELHLN